jgi:hypothetical protein
MERQREGMTELPCPPVFTIFNSRLPKGEVRECSMAQLRHVGVFSVAKISALIGLVLGLIMGIFYGALFAVLAPLMSTYSAMMGAGAIAMVIGGIILGAIFGFIYGAVLAFLYNIFADWVGGVEVELA